MEDPINQSANHKCWCPMCESNNKKIAIMAPWISPEGKLVCIYVACQDCATKMQSSSNDEILSLTNTVEKNLLNRFPNLWNKLPSYYHITDELGKVIYRSSKDIK